MTTQIFRYQHRVTYAECTVGNHVYYARYLDYLEAARGEFFRSLGMSFQRWQDLKLIFPVLQCHLRYVAPARYDDRLEVRVWIRRPGRIRLVFAYQVANQAGETLLEGSTEHVCTDLQEKPRRLPPDLVRRLEPFMETKETL